MEDLGVPDTLIHNDLNSGNILFSERGCVFTDWCESCVGNPFFAFQQLCLLQPSRTGDGNSKLRMVYRNCWLDLLQSTQIDAAFALSPLLAIFSHLYGRGTWLHSSRRNEPEVKAYARSLARHMDRAAQDSSLLEAI
jgi:aminoglycoside phosphotransferase (APT) family kinase protein